MELPLQRKTAGEGGYYEIFVSILVLMELPLQPRGTYPAIYAGY